MKRVAAVLATVTLLACQAESHVTDHKAVESPVASPNAIPDAPLNGTLRGAPFVVRDARYVIDRRIGYEHTDILLSSGKADGPCGPVAPATSTSVWLRLEGPAKIASMDLKLGPGVAGAWTVHYQVFDSDHWIGVADGSAVLSMHEAGPDGHVAGGLAVCFADDLKSCVSGAFDAQSCPSSLDQAVRGAIPPEAIPEKYRLQMLQAGAAVAPAAPDAGALPVLPDGGSKVRTMDAGSR